MKLRVLDTGLRPARWNVAASAALLRSVDEDRAPATLRFHRYPLSCVIGRNQDAATELDLGGCVASGVEIARRVTGGGAVAMGPGVIAWDLVLPERRGHEVPRRAGEALVAMLSGFGLAARLATPGSVEIDGRKVSGSAGRLGRRAVLHQATLILDLAQTAPLALLRRRTESGRPTPDPRHRVTDLASTLPHGEVFAAGEPRSTHKRVASFEARLCRAPQDEERRSFASLQARLVSAIVAAFGLTAEPGEPSRQELADATALLIRETGRDAYVLGKLGTWEDAA